MEPVLVRIVGANDAWQAAAEQTRRRLATAFGPHVQVTFYAASSPELDGFPQALALLRLGGAALPLVFIGDALFSSGSKLQIPEISRELQALGLERNGR